MNPIARSISLARSFATVATRFLPETRLVSVRIGLLRFAGATIERYARVVGYQTIFNPEHLFIEQGAFISAECLFLTGAKIHIGSNAMIGPRTIFATANHFGTNNKEIEFLQIMVEPYAWIGAGVTICPGITIGHHAAVAAGSVVMRDVAPHTRVAGNPARPLPSPTRRVEVPAEAST